MKNVNLIVVFVAILSTAFVMWMWQDYQWKKADFKVKITVGHNATIYPFPPSEVANGNFRYLPIVKCVNEDPLVFSLIEDGNIVRRSSFCPSAIKDQQIEADAADSK